MPMLFSLQYKSKQENVSLALTISFYCEKFVFYKSYICRRNQVDSYSYC